MLPAANATFHSKDRPKDTVRKGYGITGSGVNNVSPHLSGRLNIGMLQKMKLARENDVFAVEVDNEFDRVK